MAINIFGPWNAFKFHFLFISRTFNFRTEIGPDNKNLRPNQKSLDRFSALLINIFVAKMQTMLSSKFLFKMMSMSLTLYEVEAI